MDEAGKGKLRVWTGPPGSGKSTALFEEIRALDRADPLGAPLFLIVAEDASLSASQSLFTSDYPGSMRVQVMGFRRLEHWLDALAEAPLPSLPNREQRWLLADEALAALPKQGSHVLGLRRSNEGAKAAAALFDLFIENDVTPHALRTVARGDQAEQLQALATLLETYQGLWKVHGFSWARSDRLATVLRQQSWQGSRLYLDRIHRLSPAQQQALLAFVQQGAQVTVTATTRAWEDPAWVTALVRTTQAAGVETERRTFAENYRFHHPALFHLATSTGSLETPPRPATHDPVPIGVVATASPDAAAGWTVRRIRQLARTQGVRWSEMAIAARHLEQDADRLTRLLSAYRIPHVIGRGEPIRTHPLIRLVLDVLRVVESGWVLREVIEVVQNGLVPMAEKLRVPLIDALLTQAVSGATGLASLAQGHAQGGRPIPPALAHAAGMVHAALTECQQGIETAVDAPQMASSLWQLLKRWGVPLTLQHWIDEAEKAPSPDAAERSAHHRQAWQALVEALETLVSFGPQPQRPGAAGWLALLELLLHDRTFPPLPSAADALVVVELGATALDECRFLFVLGATDGRLPAPDAPFPLLGEEGRTLLCEEALLPEWIHRGTEEERFRLWWTLSRASEAITLIWSRNDAQGRAQRPSQVLTYLEHSVGPLQQLQAAPLPPIGEAETFGEALDQVTEAFMRWREGEALDAQAGALYLQLVQEARFRPRLQQRLAGLAYHPFGAAVGRWAEALYGNQAISPSVLERFAACPFAGFVANGLKLQPVWEEDRPRPTSLGRLRHQVLAEAILSMGRAAESERVTGADQVNALVDAALRRVLADPQAAALQRWLTAPAHRPLLSQLRDELQRAVLAWQQDLLHSRFYPVAAELPFEGQAAEGALFAPQRLPALTLGETQVRGIIDRVDLAEEEDALFVRVIDYKSGMRDSDLRLIADGLQLQLLTYLEAARMGLSRWPGDRPVKPAGFFYFPLQDRPSEPKKADEDPLQAYGRRHHIRGFAIDHSDAGDLLERFGGVAPAPIIPKKMPTLSEQAYATLRQLAATAAAEHTQDIREGVTEPLPYRFGSQIACDVCGFAAICHVEPAYDRERFRIVPTIKKEEFIAALQEGRDPRDGRSLAQ
ncbi:MAG: PD-(D/E)XK nuclease family protein [Firmicutes bacterium]|nr:PD-(D/E)XK nuclease family protein [Bacillota bacterium]